MLCSVPNHHADLPFQPLSIYTSGLHSNDLFSHKDITLNWVTALWLGLSHPYGEGFFIRESGLNLCQLLNHTEDPHGTLGLVGDRNGPPPGWPMGMSSPEINTIFICSCVSLPGSDLHICIDPKCFVHRSWVLCPGFEIASVLTNTGPTVSNVQMFTSNTLWILWCHVNKVNMALWVMVTVCEVCWLFERSVSRRVMGWLWWFNSDTSVEEIKFVKTNKGFLVYRLNTGHMYSQVLINAIHRL